MLHALLWIVWGEGRGDFWPFGGIQYLDDYGAAEFFVYTGLPIGCYIVFILLSSGEKSNEVKWPVIPEKVSKVGAIILSGICWLLVVFLFMLPIAIIGAKQPAPFYSFAAIGIASAVASYVYKRIRGKNDDDISPAESDNSEAQMAVKEHDNDNSHNDDCMNVISYESQNHSISSDNTVSTEKEQKSDSYVVDVEKNQQSPALPFLIFFLVISVVLNIIIGIQTKKQEDSNTSLENQIRKYNSALKEKSLELGELQKERDSLVTIQNNIGKSIPLIITDIRIGNIDNYGRIITNYGDPILSSHTYFLAPQLSYCGVIPGTYEIKVKLYYPNGKLSTGRTSPSGYSWTASASIKAGRHTTEITGWGGSDKGHYSPGTYRIEIWLNNICLRKQIFTIS